jgi:hypothetical protein
MIRKLKIWGIVLLFSALLVGACYALSRPEFVAVVDAKIVGYGTLEEGWPEGQYFVVLYEYQYQGATHKDSAPLIIRRPRAQSISPAEAAKREREWKANHPISSALPIAVFRPIPSMSVLGNSSNPWFLEFLSYAVWIWLFGCMLIFGWAGSKKASEKKR